MLFTDYLFENVKHIWNDYLNHPFLKEKLKEIFIKASIYEMRFWDMAYEEVI